jgi:hypothetical protein
MAQDSLQAAFAQLTPRTAQQILDLLAPVLPAQRQGQPAAGQPDDGDAQRAQQFYERNRAYLKSGEQNYNTPLSPDEDARFRKWAADNNVPFDMNAKTTDYDMRGFWKALQAGDPVANGAIDPNDGRMHYPDYWKTPYHESFSNESQWADPTKAPKWNDRDQLVTPDGKVLFDDRAPKGNK